MWEHAKFCRHSRERASEIVKFPGRNAYALVERSLGPRPISESSLTKHKSPTRLAGKDCQGLRRQRHLMGAEIFCSLWWEDDDLAFKVCLCPSQPTYLCTPLARQQKQSNYLAKPVAAKPAPQLAQLIMRQHSVAAASFVGPTSAGHRILLIEAFGYCPSEERRE